MATFRLILSVLALAFFPAIRTISFSVEYNKPFCFVEERPAGSVIVSSHSRW